MLEKLEEISLVWRDDKCGIMLIMDFENDRKWWDMIYNHSYLEGLMEMWGLSGEEFYLKLDKECSLEAY